MLFYKKYLDKNVYDMYYYFLNYDEADLKIEKEDDVDYVFSDFIGRAGINRSLIEMKEKMDKLMIQDKAEKFNSRWVTRASDI